MDDWRQEESQNEFYIPGTDESRALTLWLMLSVLIVPIGVYGFTNGEWLTMALSTVASILAIYRISRSIEGRLNIARAEKELGIVYDY